VNQPFSTTQIKASHILLSENIFKTPSGVDPDAFAELTWDYPNIPLRNSYIRLFSVGSGGNITDLDRPLTFHRNHGSLLDSYDVVMEKISKEIFNGHMTELHDDQLSKLPYGTANPIGVINKKGKNRIINDLSYPRGSTDSVNSHIDNLEYGHVILDSIRIIAIDLRRVMASGGRREYVMGDAKAFYRQFPRHPRDQLHQLVHLDGKTYLDHVESFGDCGAPHRCCLFGDILCWILEKKYGIQNPHHYVDNFILLTDEEHSSRDEVAFKACCEKLKLEMNPSDEYKGTTPTYLGFRINGGAGTIAIPETTRLEIAAELNSALVKGSIQYGELRSLVGRLIWISAVATMGYVYAHKALVQMEAMRSERKSFVVNLSLKRYEATRGTLTWFSDLLVQWCGVAVYRETRWEYASEFHGCSSDASPIGGAFTTPTEYSFWIWCKCGCADTTNTMRLELATILIGLSTRMGGIFSGLLVQWLSDSSSGVSAFNAGYAKDPMSSMIIAEARTILTNSQTDNFRLMWTGRADISHADSLTRGGISEFMRKAGNSKRTFCKPHSTRTVKLLPRLLPNDPLTFGFSSHH